MPLPESIRVKLSSESAGSIALTPVVVREMALAELVEELLALTGKDLPRIRETLGRGSFISGATRFRWQGWEAEEAELHSLLARYPESDPARAFDPAQCVRAVLRSAAHRVELPREAVAKRRLFRRRSYWSVLMEAVARGEVRYIEYSYRERADRYRLDLSVELVHHLRSHAHMVRYSTLVRQIRVTPVEWVEFLVERAPR